MPVDITVGKQRILVEKGFLMDEQALTFNSNVYGNAIKSSPFGVLADIHLNSLTIQPTAQKLKPTMIWRNFSREMTLMSMA